MPERRDRESYFVADFVGTTEKLTESLNDTAPPLSMGREAWLGLRRQPVFVVAMALICLVVAVVAFPGLFTSLDPQYCALSHSLDPPRAGHPFGFNRQGCDVYARVIYGARASVAVGVLTSVGVLLVGGAVGTLAGYAGGWTDAVVSRITDIFFAIPLMLAAIVVMSMMRDKAGIWSVVCILSLFGWPQMARIARAAVIQTRGADFIKASKALGSRRSAIVLRHILPNAITPMIVTATVSLGLYIVVEATLSFLGIGLPPSMLSWGAEIAQAKDSLRTNPSVLFYPAGALAVTVLAFVMLGDCVRDALDPKARKR